MTSFDYSRPETLQEACRLLAAEDAVALAGGTDLLVAVRNRTSQPALVVDLKSVGEIGDTVDVVGSLLRIGGRVVLSSLIDDPLVKEHFPALVEAASVVGSVQIRNRATLAGNLCNASPAADTAPPLLAYGAAVNVSGAEGSRTIPLQDFFIGPGSTALAAGEVVTSVEVPLPTAPIGSAFARVTRRRGVDLASVNLACAVEATGAVRFGLGAVAPTPLLVESTVEDLSTDEGRARLLAAASPISDVRAGADYRLAMLQVHSRRAFEVALQQVGATP
jgi:carbon-monoxide dehydrogenase medium subunit